MSLIQSFLSFLSNRLRRKELYGLGLAVVFILAFLSLILFVLILHGVQTKSGFYVLDQVAQDVVGPYRSPEHIRWAVFVTNLGGNRGTTLCVVVVSLILLGLRRWYSLVGLLLASGLGGLVLSGLKLLFARARPLEKLIPASGYSFPSGHAFAATVFFGYMIYLIWHLPMKLPVRLLLTLCAGGLMLAIGATRIFLNVHYTTDVIAGHLVGFVWVTGCILVVRVVERRRVRRRKPADAPEEA